MQRLRRWANLCQTQHAPKVPPTLLFLLQRLFRLASSGDAEDRLPTSIGSHRVRRARMLTAFQMIGAPTKAYPVSTLVMDKRVRLLNGSFIHLARKTSERTKGTALSQRQLPVSSQVPQTEHSSGPTFKLIWLAYSQPLNPI